MVYLFLALMIVGVLTVLLTAVKTHKFFRCLFSSALQGIAAMFAVNILGMVTGIHIAVNWYTISFSALFGTPGVIAMTMAEFLFS